MRSSGRFFSGSVGGALLRERTRPPFFARAQAAIPQIDERREARLQRREAEAIAGVLDVGAIVLLDERLDAGARLPRRLRQPAGEEHVVFGFELLQLGLEPLQIAFDGRRGHTALPGNEEPDERQPQLARVRHRPIVDRALRSRPSAPTISKQIAQPRRVARPESRAVATRGARPGLAELGRRARELERAREVRRRRASERPA